MKFNYSLLLIFAMFSFNQLRAMDESEKQITLPVEVWKNIHRYLLQSGDQEAQLIYV